MRHRLWVLSFSAIPLLAPLLPATAAAAEADFVVVAPPALSNEYDPAIAHNPAAAQYLVVWEDGRNAGTRGTDIYGRLVGANGSLAGAEFRISGLPATGDELNPAVAYNPAAGQYLVVWEDDRNTLSRGRDIYGRRVAANGAMVGGDFRISGPAATTGDFQPAVAYGSVGDQYLVVWDDGRSISRGRDIYGRLVDADGSFLGRDFRICGAGAKTHDTAPAVAYGVEANQYLVVWTDGRGNTAYPSRGFEIYGRLVAADGARDAGDFRISGPAATGSEITPATVYNPVVDEFLVAWADTRDIGTRGFDIRGRRVDADGTRLRGDFRISGVGAIRDDKEPALAYNGDNHQYLVAWQDFRNQYLASKTDTFGRRLDADGTPDGADFRISGPAAIADEYVPAAAYSPAVGQYLVVWVDLRHQATTGMDIYGRRIAG